jgi:3-hydroxypropanoate dehydrogenase
MPFTPSPIDAHAIEAMFTGARSANSWTDEPVTDDQLRAIFDLASLPPTAANSNPLRVTFVQSPEARERLVALMDEGNRAKTLAAPAVALLAVDLDFHHHMDALFPAKPGMGESFEGWDGREQMARFNAALQVGYFIMAVRAVGLAAGPMTGFDFPAVKGEFLPEPNLEPLAVVNIGHPGEKAWFEPRLPRHDFEVAARII